jgi:hypothetical protein
VISQEFSEIGKADSSVKDAFRANSVLNGSPGKTYWINGVNLIGMKKKDVVSFLGEPDFKGTINNSIPFISFFFYSINLPYITKTINYSIDNCSSDEEQTSEPYMTLEIRRNKVYEVRLNGSWLE